jgi:hypothetical protein
MSERTASPEKGTVAALSEARPQLSPGHSEDMATDIEDWRQTIEHLKTRDPAAASGQSIWLETASDIAVTPGIQLADMQLAPQNNWAKFNWSCERNDFLRREESVGFGFLWQNASDRTVVVNVTSVLGLDGICQAFADGGFFDVLDLRFCNAFVTASLNIQELWNQPPTAPPSQPWQEQRALSLHAESTGPFGDPDTKREHIERGLFPAYDQLVIPPRGTARFEVACQMSAYLRKGYASFGFDYHNDAPDGKMLAVILALNVLP